eukprot:gene11162-biopygen4836
MLLGGGGIAAWGQKGQSVAIQINKVSLSLIWMASLSNLATWTSHPGMVRVTGILFLAWGGAGVARACPVPPGKGKVSAGEPALEYCSGSKQGNTGISTTVGPGEWHTNSP